MDTGEIEQIIKDAKPEECALLVYTVSGLLFGLVCVWIMELIDLQWAWLQWVWFWWLYNLGVSLVNFRCAMVLVCP